MNRSSIWSYCQTPISCPNRTPPPPHPKPSSLRKMRAKTNKKMATHPVSKLTSKQLEIHPPRRRQRIFAATLYRKVSGLPWNRKVPRSSKLSTIIMNHHSASKISSRSILEKEFRKKWKMGTMSIGRAQDSRQRQSNLGGKINSNTEPSFRKCNQIKDRATRCSYLK